MCVPLLQNGRVEQNRVRSGTLTAAGRMPAYKVERTCQAR
jgi:hypothetical protein